MISVAIVDDQTLVRAGLRQLLQLTTDIRVVGEAADGERGLELIASMRPNVVLLDVRMPRMDGIAMLKALQKSGSKVTVILLTTFDDDEPLLSGLKAGALGFLLKDVSLERLGEAIRTVAAGGTLIQPAVGERLLQSIGRVPRDFESLDPPDPLTVRETEVLRLIAAGLSNKEIAEAFGTSEGTVKNHASNILSKLGVRDRTRAVLKALDRGYI